jgi:hypothetical protein
LRKGPWIYLLTTRTCSIHAALDTIPLSHFSL